jgi:site-specific DNA-adenine methylase
MSLGIPYMGSKRKLAGDILHFITSRHHGLTDFYDLFGGGGAVSFTAVRDYRFTTHYNELNSHVYHLVDYIRTHRTLEPKFYEWVTREEFFKQCAREDADWYSGFVMSCWSFGNKQSSYLYGIDIEDVKRLGHNVIVDCCRDSMAKLNIDIPNLFNISNIHKRRTVFCDYIKKANIKVFGDGVESRVQNLELVEHLSRMQNLQNLQITNLSYENVIIKGNNPVIYCDIPYKGTGEYIQGGFDYNRFYQWAKECQYPVYISEYNAPFSQVHAFTHRSSLSATNNKKKTIEKLFWNEKGIAHKTTFF